MTPQPLPESAGFVPWLFAAGSAFVGAVARSVVDWVDPRTGKISYPRILTSVATAILIGEVVMGLCTWKHVDAIYSGPLAGVAGYLGPAAMLSIIFNRLGVSTGIPKKGAADAPAD